MDIKTRILKELKNTDTYVSGQDICEKCGVSRTAVWKVINQLKNEGYEIDSVTNKGYKILETPDILSKSEIESVIEDGSIVKDIIYFDETDSTNTRAKLLGEEGAVSGTLVVADCQNMGKGRRGRSFSSPAGQSIYMTLLLRPDTSPSKASMITILSAMAVRTALSEVCGIEGLIKWPNDIVADGRKLCGILTEMSAELTKINYVVVGIGINVNNEKMPEDIEKIAVSARMLTGKKQKRSLIIGSVCKWFSIYYNKFIETSDLSLLKDEYNRYLIHMNKEVEIIRDNEKYRAKSLGLADDGELLIEKDGKPETVMSGEVSVRGVYGYV